MHDSLGRLNAPASTPAKLLRPVRQAPPASTEPHPAVAFDERLAMLVDTTEALVDPLGGARKWTGNAVAVKRDSLVSVVSSTGD